MTVETRYLQTLGYAGYIDGHRVTDYYTTFAAAERHTQILIENGRKRIERFDAKRKCMLEERERQKKWLAELMKKENVRVVGRKENQFDAKLWNSMKMVEARKKESDKT